METGKSYSVDAYVDHDQRRGEVTVTVKVNGKPIIDRLNVATSRLTANWWNNVDDARKFGLVAEQCDVQFHAVHLKMTDGHADLLRPVTQSDLTAQSAKWLVSAGGKLLIRQGESLQEVNQPGNLPADPFDVIAVEFTRARIFDADIWRLVNLPTLTAVRLEDALISDAALARLAELPRLARLDLSKNRNG